MREPECEFLRDGPSARTRISGTMKCMDSTDTICTFCRIVRGEEPAHIVYEDVASIAFLDREPASGGHTLVVPRVHSRNLFDITVYDAGELMASATRVARLLNATLRPDGMTLFQTNEPAGWQTAMHTHLHLVPRWSDDHLAQPWRPLRASEQDLSATCSRIRTSNENQVANE